VPQGADVIEVESGSRGDVIRYRGGADAQAAEAGMSTSYQIQGQVSAV